MKNCALTNGRDAIGRGRHDFCRLNRLVERFGRSAVHVSRTGIGRDFCGLADLLRDIALGVVIFGFFEFLEEGLDLAVIAFQ